MSFETLFTCNECFYVTHFDFALIKHMISKHRPRVTKRFSCATPIKWYQCKYCSFKTEMKIILKNHTKTCQQDCKFLLPIDTREMRKYKCSQCGYNTLSRLISYKHYHVEKCNICPFIASTIYALERHIIRRHTASSHIKWFKCEQCNYKAKIKADLRQHIYDTHLKIKNNKCGYCGYETNRYSNLKQHIINKHTPPHETEWFNCAHCSYKTNYKSTLKRHTQRHMNEHEIKWFRCDYCSYKAKRRNCVKLHAKNMHC